MSRFRNALPQLGDGLFLTDAGLETDLIFNRHIPIREFAAHTLLDSPEGITALEAYFNGFLQLAHTMDAGFVFDADEAIHYVAPVGEKQTHVDMARNAIAAFIDPAKQVA